MNPKVFNLFGYSRLVAVLLPPDEEKMTSTTQSAEVLSSLRRGGVGQSRAEFLVKSDLKLTIMTNCKSANKTRDSLMFGAF